MDAQRSRLRSARSIAHASAANHHNASRAVGAALLSVGGITMMRRIEPASARGPLSVTRKYSSASAGDASTSLGATERASTVMRSSHSEANRSNGSETDIILPEEARIIAPTVQ